MPEIDDDLIAKAKLLAEATGRDFKDVLADLEDDGVLNDSNKPKEDLVAQLKEAAELIATVQEINKEVSENTVLNGGDNKTNVNVETTLEGDIVDRAIESVHRKVQNIKKIAIVIIPVFLLLTGGTMSSMGFFNSDESSPEIHDEYNNDYGGCLVHDAINYDSYASWDDGSCQFDNTPPPCDSQWEWILYGELRGDNNVWIDARFKDMNNCNTPMDAQITMTLNKDGQYYDEKSWNNRFDNEWSVGDQFTDLPPGEYDVEVDAHAQGSNWHQNVEGDFIIEEQACIPDYSSSDSWATTYDNNSLQAHLKIINHNDCESSVGVMVSYYKENSYQDSYDEELGEYEVKGAETEIVIRHDDWTNLGDGNYSFETRFFPEGQNEECCEMTPQIQIDTYVEPEPPCNGTASFYSVSHGIDYNNSNSSLSNVTVFWDADWSCEEVKYVQIDIFFKHKDNQTVIYYQTLGYNLNGQSSYVANHTIVDIEVGATYEVCLQIWVQRDTWYVDEERNELIPIS
tara:strand:+ start:10435 stop:11973 length:1539 start_codon:yes stop_codon:yes gene_type:complete